MAYGTINADIIQSSVTGVSLGAGNATVFKNRFINGDMRIDQRNAGASVTPANTNYSLDRWVSSQTVAGKYTIQQSSTAPTGFINSLLCTSTSAYTLATSEFVSFRQFIEGLNVADLGWGTADAKTVTLSFWVRSSLTGTFGGSIANSAGNRIYVYSYTINSANTWEQKTITIAGDITGTWLTTNGIGVAVRFCIGAASDYQGTSGSWGTTVYAGPTGQTSVVGTSGATFYVTGVQLEVGSSATGFEYVDYGTQLAMCQRYYYKLGPATATDQPFCNAACYNTTLAFGVLPLPVEMRAFPTVSFTSATTLRLLTGNNGFSSTASAGSNTLKTAVEIAGTYASLTLGYSGWFRSSAAGDFIAMSAEL